MFDSIKEWFREVIQDCLDWFLDVFKWIGEHVYSGLLDGLATLIENIPAPSFIAQAKTFFGNIPSIVVFFFQYFAIAEGIGFIVAALLARFILRRIPFIG
jgi:hypothetical protein